MIPELEDVANRLIFQARKVRMQSEKHDPQLDDILTSLVSIITDINEFQTKDKPQ